MRIAVLADVHGNLAALEAVLADIARQPVDRPVRWWSTRAASAPRPSPTTARTRT
jgi:hypothetical protein